MIIFNKAQCPSCGAPLKINKKDGIATCECCGTEYILELTNSSHRVKALENKPKITDGLAKPVIQIYTGNKFIYVLIIIGILLAIIGSILIGVCYDGYDLYAENGDIICSNIAKCHKTINNITYKYKIDISNITAYDQYNILITSSDNTYLFNINRVLAKDGYIYINEAPVCATTNYGYSYISLNLANNSEVIAGIVLLIVGVLLAGFFIYILRD